MVHGNPGENDPATHFLDPAFLAERHFHAQVIEHAIEGVPTFSAFDPSLIPPGSAAERNAIQSATAITHGESSHVALINLLRDEVCVKARRFVYYRTWDFGNNFHNNPKYYLDVTDAITPHPLLIFSIKHQSGDFHRLPPFNASLATGRHRQGSGPAGGPQSRADLVMLPIFETGTGG